MIKRNFGFTIIELLIVIGIMATLTGITSVSYFGIRSKITFENQVSEISTDLRWTMSRSLAQESSDQWGIRFDNPVGESNDFYEVWHGGSYATGTILGRTNLHGSVSFLDPAPGASKDIIFSKASGLPTASSTLELYSLSGSSTGTIDINILGRIDVTFN